MKYSHIFLIFFSVFSGTSSAQHKSPSAELIAPLIKTVVEPSIAIIPTQTLDKELEVSQFKVNSEIHGNLAETTLDITFQNPNNRVLSADFLFPIPHSSMLSGYALDVNGKMVDGVAVEKNKARVTFEKIVRQGIDPGLVEKVQGNVFKTRIFPIEANHHRRIQIRFFSVLDNSQGHYSYQIPLMNSQMVKDFSLKIQAMNTLVKPIITTSQFNELEFSQWENAFITEYNRNELKLDKNIHIQIPLLADNLTVVGKNRSGENYFVINPQLKPIVPNYRLAAIKHIQLVWDASHSRKNAEHLLAFKLLNEFFDRHKNVVVELYWLRNELKVAGTYTINKGNWESLKRQLEEVEYDGGTDLSELNQLNKSKQIQAVLLFSDGLHTFDKKTEVVVNQALHIFNYQLSSNQGANKLMAQRNAGQAYYLNPQTDMNKVISQLSDSSPQLLSFEVTAGQVSGLPEVPMNIDLNNSHPITGQLISQQASLKLNFGFNAQVKQTVEVELSTDQATLNSLPELLWAKQQVAHLQVDSKNNKHKIVALSKKYNLVSDHTSLIVLESLDQYVEHQIPPPESLPKMLRDYRAQIKTQDKKQVAEKHKKINQVIELWQTRKSWWNKKFPIHIETKKVREPESPIASMSDRSHDDMEMQAEITVTGSRLSASAEAPLQEANGVSENKNIASQSSGPRIEISAWDPETPYVRKLANTEKPKQLELYYQLKQQHLNSPAFYFDCASFFFQSQQPELGLQVLSNIAELKVQDSRLMRTMAMKLKQHNYLDLSIQTYLKVLEDRPEEPQSHRDLALALIDRADSSQSKHVKQDYQLAIKSLYEVITNRWDRFFGIEVTALMEINRLIPILKQHQIDTSFIDHRLIQLLEVDIRIVLGWDSDMTDIDLWVIEPSGEKITYSHTLSGVGGMFHQDFTGGYGPEEYLIKKAPKGKYTIKVHFYGNNSPELSGATNLYVDVFTHYGKPNQQKQTLSLRLDKANDDYLVGAIAF